MVGSPEAAYTTLATEPLVHSAFTIRLSSAREILAGRGQGLLHEPRLSRGQRLLDERGVQVVTRDHEHGVCRGVTQELLGLGSGEAEAELLGRVASREPARRHHAGETHILP